MFKRREWAVVLRWLCYGLLLVVAAVLQSVPGLLKWQGVGPVFLVPLCLAVALYEGEVAGALFGALSGIVWDTVSVRVSGFFAIILLVACFLASCLYQLYLRDGALNFLWVTALATLVALSLDFMVVYRLPDMPAPGVRYLTFVLPVVLVTTALSPLVRLMVRRVSRIGAAEREAA